MLMTTLLMLMMIMMNCLVELHRQVWSLKVERHKLELKFSASMGGDEVDNNDEDGDGNNGDYEDEDHDFEVEGKPGSQSSRRFVA